ncbi:hypothetical protein ON010_g13821 [Phytophthora cinnamomi]|nr:hypothetical protein ON010_g13821 [Phytophthora cinnamomi]
MEGVCVDTGSFRHQSRAGGVCVDSFGHHHFGFVSVVIGARNRSTHNRSSLTTTLTRGHLNIYSPDRNPNYLTLTMLKGESSTSEATSATASNLHFNFGGHGGCYDPDEHGSAMYSLRSPHTNQSLSSQPSYLRVNSPKNQRYWPAMLKRGHRLNEKALKGKLSEIPRHWLWVRFLNNSFFARRLMRSGMLLAAGLAFGVLSYAVVVKAKLENYKSENPDAYDTCEALVTFSAVIYKTLPAAIVLSLPGSGLRAFEPFKRKSPSTASISMRSTRENDGLDSRETQESLPGMTKVRRCFIFQLCEVLAVCMLLFDFALVTYFLRLLFIGAIDSCGDISTQAFALGGAFCYAGLFVVLYYFARYREHIKMQLGAFQEADQTGDVRKHGHVGSNRTLNSTGKILSVVRTRLYYATRRGDLEEMREILAFVKARGLMNSDDGFPLKAYTAPKIRWKFFAKSRANPVHVAASLGNIRALELLDEYGFSFDELDKVQRVVISTGGFFWHFAQIIVSRPKGSDEDTATSVFHTSLMTPLHCAVATGQLATVRWLLQRGVAAGTLARASFRSNRVPPLFLAEHAEIARELLLHGADPLVIPEPAAMVVSTETLAGAAKINSIRVERGLPKLHIFACRRTESSTLSSSCIRDKIAAARSC